MFFLKWVESSVWEESSITEVGWEYFQQRLWGTTQLYLKWTRNIHTHIQLKHFTGRFDLRLPYAEQVCYGSTFAMTLNNLPFAHGISISPKHLHWCVLRQGWVDEEGDNGNFFSNLFGGGKKKKEAEEKEVQAKETPAEEPKKNGLWPF